jgi:hypothetical protein
MRTHEITDDVLAPAVVRLVVTYVMADRGDRLVGRRISPERCLVYSR